MSSVSTVLDERIDELRRDREHGGSWMARRAVEALVEEAEQDAESGEALVERLLSAGRELAASRPGVGAVAGAVGRVLAAAQRERHLQVDQLRQLVGAEAESLLDGRRRAGASIAVHLKERLTDAIVLTHSASATVRTGANRGQAMPSPVSRSRMASLSWVKRSAAPSGLTVTPSCSSAARCGPGTCSWSKVSTSQPAAKPRRSASERKSPSRVPATTWAALSPGSPAST